MRAHPIVVFFFLVASSLAASPDPFTFTSQPGPHAVGLRVVLQYDYSRSYREPVDVLGHPYSGERARPIQTLIWYPAAKSTASALRLGDYLSLYTTEEDFSPSPAVAAALMKAYKRVFDADDAPPMWAVKDATPEPGRFPVLVYAPSFSAQAYENANLCEFLASHGYIVIASPDMGAHTRGMTSDLPGVEAQAQDISFLIGFARTIPEADRSAVAVAGFSWGGISNLFAAARDNRIKALISLDGSARYFPKLIAESKYVHPDEMTVPVLFFTQHEMPLELIDKYKLDLSANVLNQMRHADVTIIRMQAMEHQHFASLFNHSHKLWAANAKGDYTAQEISESYGWVSKYTLRFLDANLKHEKQAAQFLEHTPARNGVPSHLMIVDHRPAAGPPATFETFLSAVGEKGFDHLTEVYGAMTARDKEFKIPETRINSWAYDLISHSHTAEAISALKLNVSLYPASWKVYDSLAQAYEVADQKDLAIANFKKSLELNPDNENATNRLKELNR